VFQSEVKARTPVIMVMGRTSVGWWEVELSWGYFEK